MWNTECCDWNVWQNNKKREEKAIDENNASDTLSYHYYKLGNQYYLIIKFKW